MGGAKLVPITREVLRAFYQQHPLEPVPEGEVEAHIEALKRVQELVGKPGSKVVESVSLETPPRIDDNFWRTRMHCEEAAFYLALVCKHAQAMPASCRARLEECQARLLDGDKTVQAVQASNTEAAAAQVKGFLPQDFRAAFIESKRQATEAKNKKAVDDLIKKGGSIRARYDLYLKQQWERREALVQMGNLSGVYRLLVKYLGGVPQVLLDFAKEINAKLGPMEEQRLKYGPDLYRVCGVGNELVVTCAVWAENAAALGEEHDVQATEVVAAAADFFVSHLCRVVQFLGVLFTKSPFFITADDAEAAAHAEGARSSLHGATAPSELQGSSSLARRLSLKASKTGAPHHGAHHPPHELDESEQLSESDVGALRDGVQPHCADALLAAVGLHPHPPHGAGAGSITTSAGQGSLLSPAGNASFHTAAGGGRSSFGRAGGSELGAAGGLRASRSGVKRQSSQSGQGAGGGAGGLGGLFRSSAAAALPTQASGASLTQQQQQQQQQGSTPAGAGAAQGSVSAGQVPVVVVVQPGGAAQAQVQADLARGPQRSAPFAAGAAAAAPAADGHTSGAGARRVSLPQQQQPQQAQGAGVTPFLAVSRIPGLEDGGAAAPVGAGGGAGSVVSPMLTLMPSTEFLSCVDNMSWVSSVHYQGSVMDDADMHRTSRHHDSTSGLAAHHVPSSLPMIQSEGGDLAQLEHRHAQHAQQQPASPPQQQGLVMGSSDDSSQPAAAAVKVEVAGAAGGGGKGAAAAAAAERGAQRGRRRGGWGCLSCFAATPAA